MTTRVRSVSAPIMPSTSCEWSGRFGTGTPVAPATVISVGYASKERHAWTTSSPGPAAAVMSWERIATDPAPACTWSTVTPKRSASAVRSRVAPASG
jgi:hypothetical protein